MEVGECESKSQWNTGCNLQTSGNNHSYDVIPTLAINLKGSNFRSLECLHFWERMCKTCVERYTRSPTGNNIGGDRVDLAATLSLEGIKSCLTTSLISTILLSLSAVSTMAPAKGNNLSTGVEG